ncbi:Site-specific recombinase XerD [Catalinimonas alkaloidigena]|uniref:Site-specific recombinase XerD n=1 Tax=Catalinimonas alkaloidigena TaxID=1075417 RepID=A0A1G9AMF5_9BACT|nr:site-specific integrase [Catalinimonas alkaloidigena]SDK27705.1 Site-specific recombinase XerD [Catalinimonas alkaloidigena]
MRVLLRLRRNVRNPERISTLYARVTISGLRATTDFSTRIQVYPDQWDSTNQRVLGDSERAELDNEAIERVRNDLRTLFNQQVALYGSIDPDTLQALYLGRKASRSVTLLNLVIDYLHKEAERKQWTPSTKGIYQDYTNNLVEFLESIGRKQLPPMGFDETMAQDFFYWLRKKSVQARSAKHLQWVKRALQDAVRRRILGHNPIEYMNWSKGAPPPIVALSDAELALLETYRFSSPILQRVADCFTLQCYTGLAYGELVTVQRSAIHYGGPMPVLVVVRHKTKHVKNGRTYRIPLIGKAVALLERYGYEMPVYKNQQYNRYLKEVAAILGIEKNLTTHVGRKTAGMIWLNNNVPLETVSKLLGHTKLSTTQLSYAEVLDHKAIADMAAFEARTSKPGSLS